MGAPIFALLLYIIAYIVVYKIDSNLPPPFQNNRSYRIFKCQNFKKEVHNLMRFSEKQGQISHCLFRSILKVQEYSKRECFCFKILNEAPKELLLARNP